jgi:hypothetical protein
MERTINQHIWRHIPYRNTVNMVPQTMSLNISIAMAKHLTTARNRLTNKDKQIENDIMGHHTTPSQKQDSTISKESLAFNAVKYI